MTIFQIPRNTVSRTSCDDSENGSKHNFVTSQFFIAVKRGVPACDVLYRCGSGIDHGLVCCPRRGPDAFDHVNYLVAAFPFRHHEPRSFDQFPEPQSYGYVVAKTLQITDVTVREILNVWVDWARPGCGDVGIYEIEMAARAK
jgi:hypothetical protein